MMDDFEETFVLDDLLSFLACKLNKLPRDILFKRIREFYSVEIISSSLKTLLESLPSSYDFPDKEADPLEVMFECLQILPEEDKPVFLCRNLDNVPKLSGDKTHTNEWLTDALHLKNDQEKMKTQLERISSHVITLRSQFQSAQEKILTSLNQDSDDDEEEMTRYRGKINTVIKEAEKARSQSPPKKIVKTKESETAGEKSKLPSTPIAKKIIFVQEEGKLRMIKPSS